MEYEISNLPGELQVQIKKELNNKNLLSYKTRKQILEYNKSKREKQARKCGLYNIDLNKVKFDWCKCGHQDCILYMKELGFDHRDYFYSECHRLLMRACKNNDLNFVKFLSKHTTVVCDSSLSALTECCKYDRKDILQYLLEDVHIPIEDLKESYRGFDITAIHYACIHNSQNVLKYLIEEKGIDVEWFRFKLNIRYIDYGKYSPFQCACLNGKLELVKYLTSVLDLTVSDLIVKKTNDNIIVEMINRGCCDNNHSYHCIESINVDNCLPNEVVFNVVKYLIEYFKLTVENFTEEIIYEVCERGSLNMLKYLLEDVGLTFEYVRYRNDKAYKLSLERRNRDIVIYLRKIYLKNGVNANKI